MKILISSDGVHAHYYQRIAWLKAFIMSGMEALFWDCKTIPAFDAFDRFEPDVFLGQLYNIDEPLLKCIYERPHLKVGLRAGDGGSHLQQLDPRRFNVLTASPQEIELIKRLKAETGKPNFVHIHYDKDAVAETHDSFASMGVTTLSVMMCADVGEYFPSTHDDSLACDVGFVGGYWPYKGQIIDRYLFPLCYPVGKYNIKIFGNRPWQGINQYCGAISDNRVKDLFKSAKICPNLSEPHAHEYGFDVNERVFKVLCAGGFCISDNVKSLEKIFKDRGVVFAESPQDFSDKLDHYLKSPEERQRVSEAGRSLVLDGHTNFHRVSDMLTAFGCDKEAEDIMSTWSNARRNLNV